MAVSKAKQQQRDREYFEYVDSAPEFGLKDKLGYMFGDLGGNTLQVIVNTYLLLFMTSIVGIKATHFAIIVAVCKALDAINDPFIGHATDRAPGTKRGKFNNIIALSSIPMSILTVMLFLNVQSFPYALKIVWCLLIYFIWGVVSTFWNIPYGSMMNSITASQTGRAELSNFRSIGSAGANVLVQTVAPLLIYNNLNEATAKGFLILSVAGGIFSIICLAITTRWTRERVVITTREEGRQKLDLKGFFKAFVKNRPMIAIILAYIITKFFIQTTGITNQYVFQVYFQDTETLALAGIVQLVPLIVCMPLLKPMVKRFGKKNLVTWPILLSALTYAVLVFVPVRPIVWIGLQGLAIFFMGFFNLLVWSLIADGVDYHAWLTRERNDGTVYSIVTFMVFLVSSLSTSFITLLLDAVGFEPLLQANQAPGVAISLKTTFASLPVIGCLLIFFIFMFVYNLTDEEMAKISQEVNEMSQAKEAAMKEEM